MATTNLGKVGLTPKNTYSAGTTYERLDLVTDGDSSYVSLRDNNVGHPVTDRNWWQVSASGASATAAGLRADASAQRADEAAANAALVREQVSGTEVALDVVGNREYICGEVKSLALRTVEDSPNLSIIRFTSGATATSFSCPDSLPITGWKIPQVNRSYSIFVWFGAATIVYDG